MSKVEKEYVIRQMMVRDKKMKRVNHIKEIIVYNKKVSYSNLLKRKSIMKKNNSEKQNDTNVRTISAGTGKINKPDKEPPTECNPNNGAFFEERSNPLSSKGN